MKKKKLTEYIFENPKTLRIAVIVGIAGIVLIFISSYVDFTTLFSKSQTIDEYSMQMEQSLHSVITQIDGVGQAKIFLTMDNDGENVYLKNSDTKTKSISPKVRGVVIVCTGGDDPVVVSRVMSAVTRSLDISSDKVCITKLSQ